MNRWTSLVHFDPCPQDPFHANNTPIYQTATFAQEEAISTGQYDYTRSGNPTRTVLQTQLAKLESAQYAFAFNSGIAALHAVFGLLSHGDHIVASDDLYGGTYRLLSKRLSQRGITFSLVDTTNLAAVSAAILANTKLLLIETPSNPLQKISDIAALATLAHQENVLFAVDNTFLSPWLQQPLLLGADIVIHSATKHLGGHSDLTAGVVMVNECSLAEELAFIQNSEGTALTPFESFLLLRGIKTLGLRIERQQITAASIVNYLASSSFVKQIYYPGLKTHPGFDLQQKQARGAGTVISFETGSPAISKKLVEGTDLFTISVSFGSLSSLISLPSNMSHASIHPDQQRFSTDLVRLSIGIEDENDLIEDLDKAFSLCK